MKPKPTNPGNSTLNTTHLREKRHLDVSFPLGLISNNSQFYDTIFTVLGIFNRFIAGIYEHHIRRIVVPKIFFIWDVFGRKLSSGILWNCDQLKGLFSSNTVSLTVTGGHFSKQFAVLVSLVEKVEVLQICSRYFEKFVNFLWSFLKLRIQSL